MITNNLCEHPAVKAWSLLNSNFLIPETIEEIRDMNASKAYVLRLVGAGENGSSVIAKNTHTSKAMIEWFIYENALISLSKTTLHCYGYLKDKNNKSWIFIEDAGGISFSFSNIHHASLAIDWLAELHTSVPQLENMPDRGLGYYYSMLIDAHNKIMTYLSDNAFRDEDINLLRTIVFQLEYLKYRWPSVHSLYEQMPKGMIHGDFRAKNLRIRSDTNENILLVFDWEFAGWGLPGIDMYRLDPENYWLKVRDHWSNTTFENVIQLSSLGKLLSCLNAINWESTSLGNDDLDKTLENMKVYKLYLADAIRDNEKFF